MGSASSVECCQPHPSAQEFSSIVSNKIHAISVVEESYLAIKEAVCRTAFLSEIDYYITKLKQNQAYLTSVMQLYPSFDDLIDAFSYEPSPQWVVPIQSKTYDLAINRFNPHTSIAFPIEFGLIDPNSSGVETLFTKGNLKKTSLLLLQQNFRTYKEEEYLQLLLSSLHEWDMIQEFAWVLDPQATYADMSRHLLYHWNRCVNFINRDISLNDAPSWARARFLYNFFIHVIADSPLPLIQEVYFLDNWVYEAEGLLLAPGQILTFFGFSQFLPYFEENVDYEEDTVRFNPPKGEEEVPHIKIKYVVKPSNKRKHKFRCNQYLYYLPLTIFIIQNIEQKYGQLFVFLQEQPTQCITNYIANNVRPSITTKKQGKDSGRAMINQLTTLRENTAKHIEQQEGNSQHEQSCLDYYKKYVKSRVALMSEHELPILSKKELQICEDDVKVALDEQPTLEEVESQPRWVPVTPQETAVMQRDLQRYIKRIQFQKLQSQIDSADKFANITSLNISQCWLERLECLHCFPNLLELFAYSNLIQKIEGLQHNQNLRLLSLARNEVEVLENIGHLIHLRELYLTKNRFQLPSALYLSDLNLPKLKLLTISFKQQADECFQALMRRPPPHLKQLVINEADQLAHRTKNSLRRRLKGVDIQYIHN